VWRRFKQPTWAGLAGAISALLIAASLSGCGSLPRPFQPEHKASPQAVAGQLGSRAGVLIRAVPGLESAVSSDLAAKIATALHQREILAVTEGANRASYSLEGRLQDTERRTVAWQLVDATGRAQLAFETAAPNGTEDTTLIAEVADRVAAYFLPPVARADQPDRVVVLLVDGAPGDGGHALAASMRQSLVAAGVPVSESIVDDAYLVLGSVFTSPLGETEQEVEITWTLMRPDGSRVGTVDQRNTVPVGALDGRWGPVARFVGDFGAQGIVAMLDRLKTIE